MDFVSNPFRDHVAVRSPSPHIFEAFRDHLSALCRQYDVDTQRPPTPAVKMSLRLSQSPVKRAQELKREKRRLARKMAEIQLHSYLSPVQPDGKLENIWAGEPTEPPQLVLSQRGADGKFNVACCT